MARIVELVRPQAAQDAFERAGADGYLIQALHRPFNHKQPGAAHGVAVAAEDVRPNFCLSCLEQKCILNLFN